MSQRYRKITITLDRDRPQSGTLDLTFEAEIYSTAVRVEEDDLRALRDVLDGYFDPQPSGEMAAIARFVAEPASKALEWHEGRHRWEKHDSFPRHQHSVNGVLTISPHSTQLHFRGGKAFD